MVKHSPGPWIWTRNGRLVDATGKPMVDWCFREPVDESYVVTPADPDRRLIAEAPAMLELLKKHEWSSYDSPNDPQACCPECGAYQSAMGTPRPGYGAHRTDCAWALLVARIEGEP